VVAVVCPAIEAVVPSLNVVVCSNGQHEGGPAGRRPHCTSNPGVSYEIDKFKKTGSGGAVTETLEQGRDISTGRKSRAISCRIYLYMGLIVR